MPDAAIAHSTLAQAGFGAPVEPDGEQGSRPSAETKHERFLRLAPKRVQAALDALDRIGKLSLAENEYSEHEAARIVCALRERLTEVEGKLGRKKPEKKVFSFD